MRDIHFSDGGSRIYFFQPKTPHSSASVGFGEHVPQSSPYRAPATSRRQGLRAIITQFGINTAGLLETVDVAPVGAAVLSTANDFPTLAQMKDLTKKRERKRPGCRGRLSSAGCRRRAASRQRGRLKTGICHTPIPFRDISKTNP